MFLNRQSPTVRLMVTLIVAAWLTVCGQTCAKADVGAAGQRTLAEAAHTGGQPSALPAGGIVAHEDRGNIPRHGLNDPGCDASACCAKVVASDHGRLSIAAALTPSPAATMVLYTLPVAALTRAAAPTAPPRPVPDLTPLQITGILRI